MSSDAVIATLTDMALIDSFKAELRRNFNYARFSCPSLKGDGMYYFSYNTGLQNQTPTFRVKKDLVAESAKEQSDAVELFFDVSCLHVCHELRTEVV